MLNLFKKVYTIYTFSYTTQSTRFFVWFISSCISNALLSIRLMCWYCIIFALFCYGRTHSERKCAEMYFCTDIHGGSSCGNIESWFIDLGLGKGQISRKFILWWDQNSNRLSAFVIKPESFSRLKTDKNTSSKLNHLKIFLKYSKKTKAHLYVFLSADN